MFEENFLRLTVTVHFPKPKSKLVHSFPLGHFSIDSFHAPFRFDRDKNGGEIILHIWEDIQARVLSHNFSSAESFFVEIILHKKKWLINCSYNPNKYTLKIMLKHLVEH